MDTPLTVTELNQTARLLLEEGLGRVWVEGEVSNLAKPSSGHWYFSLKDKNAQVRVAMFVTHNGRVHFEPKNGDQVLVFAKVSLYEARGEYQLIAEAMELAGEGALQRAFEVLKRRLEQQGLFDPQYKKMVPKHPCCIGVITSPTGAALRDILHVLKRRAPSVPVIIYPTAVQGAEAASQIVNALQLANQRQECDVLIIARGGGSLEDLWPFNEEKVAQAIFASTIPVVSGVGHEIDFTISDWVADLRAPTPSAAAELVSPDHMGWQDYLLKTREQLQRLLQQKLHYWQQELVHWQKRLKHPRDTLEQWNQQVDYFELRLKACIQKKIQEQKQYMILLSSRLNSLSPLATLARGYSIIFDAQKNVISSVKMIVPDSLLSVQLQDGVVYVKSLN